MLVGGGSVKQLGGFLQQMGLSRPLVVTDEFLARGPALTDLQGSLNCASVSHDVFSDVIPDPTTESVDRMVQRLNRGTILSIIIT
jgi:alcohol dehydrogenase class IV